MSTNRWTSDHLLSEQGVALYSDQIRNIFREYGRDMRALADEVQGHLEEQPIDGDNALTRRLHAWMVARHLRDMAKSAQAVMDSAIALQTAFRKTRIELPQARAEKAAKKELHKARKQLTASPSGVINQVADAASAVVPAQQQPGQAPAAPSQPVMALGDLFQRAE
ncbi:hypothetical protein ACIQV3_35840 [Streptomyces sp. NPDC099050]|uniref:hypothetical protein n=1 Tax=Streptomyces sp. NPDC099050 TaxID=3366100 RepID=UPI00381BFFDA